MKKYFKWAVFLLSIVALVTICVFYFVHYKEVFTSQEALKEWILGFDPFDKLCYILLQVFQIIVFIIPGEITQVVGGVLYGVWGGLFLAFIGIVIGDTLAFFFAKWLGRDMVQRFVASSQSKIAHKIMNYGSNPMFIFFIHVIPGVPKDILAYVCGVSQIRFRDYFIASSLGRLPGLILSVLFGAHLFGGNNQMLVIIGVIVLLFVVIGAIFRKKIEASIRSSNPDTTDHQKRSN